MKDPFALRVTGGAFIAAALMLWFGWFLLPVKIGTFFAPTDFGQIHEQFHFWIWMYRIHIFGMITTVIALFAFAAMVSDSPARILAWPGAAVASAGVLVGSIGAAFYYHHGAWGSIELAGQTALASQAFVDALRVDTEYVTCLVRFGRVFGGLGFLVMAWAVLRFGILPAWSGWMAGVLGVAAMALTMAFPDNLDYYMPIFHATVLWMLGTGAVLWRGASQKA